MINTIKAFIKTHPVWAFISLFIFTCISPHIFYGVHWLLDCIPFLQNNIKIGIYLNYMAIAFTGVPSAVIAIYALYVARKAEEREQAEQQTSLRIAQEELHTFISNSCHMFYEVSQCLKRCTDIARLPDAEKLIMQLTQHGYLENGEDTLCSAINNFVLDATDTSRTKSDADLADEFCSEFLEHKNSYVLKEKIENLLVKLKGCTVNA